jgi:hypothetical protein
MALAGNSRKRPPGLDDALSYPIVLDLQTLFYFLDQALNQLRGLYIL